MFDFFEKLLGFVESFFEYFITFCESLIRTFELLLTSVTFPVFISGYLPSFLGSCVIIVTSVAIVKFIIGR